MVELLHPRARLFEDELALRGLDPQGEVHVSSARPSAARQGFTLPEKTCCHEIALEFVCAIGVEPGKIRMCAPCVGAEAHELNGVRRAQ